MTIVAYVDGMRMVTKNEERRLKSTSSFSGETEFAIRLAKLTKHESISEENMLREFLLIKNKEMSQSLILLFEQLRKKELPCLQVVGPEWLCIVAPFSFTFGKMISDRVKLYDSESDIKKILEYIPSPDSIALCHFFCNFLRGLYWQRGNNDKEIIDNLLNFSVQRPRGDNSKQSCNFPLVIPHPAKINTEQYNLIKHAMYSAFSTNIQTPFREITGSEITSITMDIAFAISIHIFLKHSPDSQSAIHETVSMQLSYEDGSYRTDHRYISCLVGYMCAAKIKHAHWLQLNEELEENVSRIFSPQATMNTPPEKVDLH